MICLSGTLMNMTALVLSQTSVADDGNAETGAPNGSYEYKQNPISGGLERVWVPAAPEPGVEQPSVINEDPLQGPLTNGRRINCSVRGILEGGIRVTATTERFSTRGNLDIVDYVEMEFPRGVVLSRRDRITDIRDSNGNLIWIEEESTNYPTVFEVTGVTPVTDPFGKHFNNFTLLARAEDQASFWNRDEASASG